jgi:hypothetical protein
MFNPRPPWSRLLAGIAALLLLAVTVITILTRVGIGQLPGRKFTIYALAAEARGILRGSDIWIAGRRVGTVSEVAFLPPVASGESRTVITMDILADRRELVRANSTARVRGGTRLIGNPVVEIAMGTVTSRAISDGDTIRVARQFDGEAVASRAEVAMAELPQVVRDMRTALSGISSIDSLVSPVFGAVGGEGSARSLVAAFAELVEMLNRGLPGQLLRDTLLSRRMASLRASGDSLSSIQNVDNSPALRFAAQEMLWARMDSVALEFQDLLARATARIEEYTAGARAAALRVELDRLTASLRALRYDARRHPFRYIIF